MYIHLHPGRDPSSTHTAQSPSWSHCTISAAAPEDQTPNSVTFMGQHVCKAQLHTPTHSSLSAQVTSAEITDIIHSREDIVSEAAGAQEVPAGAAPGTPVALQ